jgi:8-oxo-dGTP pyrophosphatase MutT (NUDIX family)
MKTVKTLSHKLVYGNKYAKVFVDEFAFDNTKGEYVYISKPFHDAVAMLPIRENSIYLTTQYRYPVRKMMLQVVMGGVDEKETPIESAKRELQEEAGISGSNWQELGILHAEPGLSDQTTYIYYCDVTTMKASQPDWTEIDISGKYYSEGEIMDLIHNGQITCGFTLSTLMLYFTKKHNYSYDSQS